MREKEILSNELKVACVIFDCEQRGEKVWFTKLVEHLKGELAPSTIMKSLRTLIDFGIVKAQFGETGKGRAGRLLYISGESKGVIKHIYDEFWKNQ